MCLQSNINKGRRWPFARSAGCSYRTNMGGLFHVSVKSPAMAGVGDDLATLLLVNHSAVAAIRGNAKTKLALVKVVIPPTARV